MNHVLTICASCPLGQSGLADRLVIDGFQITQTQCMSGCTKPSTLAFRAPGKTAYLFGEIMESDLADVLTFAKSYLNSADGTFADARIFGALRTKAIARIPAWIRC